MTMQSDAPVQEVQRRAIPADTFRARLKLARLHAGDLTIRQAAARCDLNPASWANWEKGMDPRGKDQIVEAISEGLDIDREWLMYGGPLVREERRIGRVLNRGERKAHPTSRYGPVADHPMRPQPTGPTNHPSAAQSHNHVTRPAGHAPTPTAPGQRRTSRVNRPVT